MADDGHDGSDLALGADDAREVTAAEYTLGLLEPSERDAVARRMARDPDLARAVGRWNARLTPLLADAPDRPARAGLLRDIEREIAGARGAHDLEASGVVVRDDVLRREARARDAADKAKRRASAERAGLWSSLVFWRGLSLSAVAACAALMLAVVTERDLRPLYGPVVTPIADRFGLDVGRPEPLLAALGPADASDVFLLSFDGGRLSAHTVSLGAEARVPELWLVPDDGSAPRSLGILPPPGEARAVAVPDARDLAALRDGTVLAVSLEPPGGAPGGVATGPVVAQGRLVIP